MDKKSALAKAEKIKLMVFDVDGVFTEGQLLFGPNGEEYKIFHVHDGLGIKFLQKADVEIAIISSRIAPAVTQRMELLGIKHIYQGYPDKLTVFNKLLQELKLLPEQVAYVGDDAIDLPILKRVGLGIYVPNAHFSIKLENFWQTTAFGGKGAVREVCDLLLEAQGKFASIYESF